MKKILLLHGAIGSEEQMLPLAKYLEPAYEITMIDFIFHGKDVNIPVEFSIDLFSNQVSNYLDKNQIDKINIFGYSMGGYVGMALAAKYPQRIESVITLGTKFIWTPESAQKETAFLNFEKILEKAPKFAELLKARHSDDKWIPLLEKTASMMLKLPDVSDYYMELFKKITIPILIIAGDSDTTAGLEDSLFAYRLIPISKFCVLPSTPHPIEKVNLTILAGIINQFLQN
jgi:pimeloyl-ACP methyl ester carboxylesterase